MGTEPGSPPSPPAARDSRGEPERRPRRRVAGVDLARAVAILGMFAVHIGPGSDGGLATQLYSLPHGRASILFALVAGVGVSFLASTRRRSAGQARVTLAWRVVLLLPLGLALQDLDHGVAVILQDYAVLFVLALLALGLADRWLLALAALAAVAGPLGFLWGQVGDLSTFARQSTVWGQAPATIAHRLVLSGPYPLITWAAPFLLGMWLGRRDLLAARTQGLLVTAGGLAAVMPVAVSLLLQAVLGGPVEPGSWLRVISADPHSQMPLWLWSATGSAAFALGACLLLVRAATAHGNLVRGLLWSGVATGQMALTVYVGHLLALHAAPGALRGDDVATALGLLAGFTLAAVVVAVGWRARFAHGPLEALLRPPWQRRAPGSTPTAS